MRGSQWEPVLPCRALSLYPPAAPALRAGLKHLSPTHISLPAQPSPSVEKPPPSPQPVSAWDAEGWVRLGAAFWGGIWYFRRYFPSSLPFLWILFVLFALPLGLWGGFCPLMGPYGGTVCRVGSVQLLERQPSPQQPARLTGLFAKHQRNRHPAELLTRPKEAQWGLGVMQVPERERQGGWLIPTSPFFTLKVHSSWGRGPVRFGPLIPALLDHGGYFPLAPVSARLQG